MLTHALTPSTILTILAGLDAVVLVALLLLGLCALAAGRDVVCECPLPRFDLAALDLLIALGRLAAARPYLAPICRSIVAFPLWAVCELCVGAGRQILRSRLQLVAARLGTASPQQALR